MDPQRWAQIEALYHTALAMEAGERPEYLAAACAHEPELQKEVQSLLSCAEVDLVSPAQNGTRWPTSFRLGSYEILAPLGAGGMGEVYRARDTKLRREVAIKVLPLEFQSDPSRLARFEREAQLLAALNHPRIAAIYGLEEFQGIRFLVLELIEGPTLAERLASGPIAWRDALRIGVEIAEALEAAHDKGVIHRDLKPANIKLTTGGQVKVLDFGLAKALGGPAPAAGSRPDSTHSPTATVLPTVAGLILGTPAYMSPEQAQGESLDKRTDIWSFAVVIYEMLTGRPAFGGKTISHVMVHVMEQEPDWNALPPDVPAGVRELLGRCLEKDRAQRLREMADVRLLLPVLAKQSAAQQVSSPLQPRRRDMVWLARSLAAAGCLAALLLGVIRFRSEPTPPPMVSLEISQPDHIRFTSGLRLSPDGRKLAFIANGPDGVNRMWVRWLDSFDPPRLGIEADGTLYPIWSPDSRFIAYGNVGKLYRIEVMGGQPDPICTAPQLLLGGFWTSDDHIIYGGVLSPLQQVSATGGVPSEVTKLDASRSENGHAAPSPLPDGRHFLYRRAQSRMQGSIYIGSLDAKPGEQGGKRLIADALDALYVPSSDPAKGFVLFARANASGSSEGTLMAQAFDNRSLELTGTPALIAENVSGFSVSASGVVAWSTGNQPIVAMRKSNDFVQGRLTWLDRNGRAVGTVGEAGTYATLALSPDGKGVAFERPGSQRNSDIWFLEFARGLITRLTVATVRSASPVWSPDGGRIAYRGRSGDHFGLYQIASNGAAKEEALNESRYVEEPTSWSRDGRYLLIQSVSGDPKNAFGLSVFSLEKRKPSVILDTEFDRRAARFSPDSRFIAYASNESGRYEIYVRPFDSNTGSAAGPRWPVSKAGGDEPRWRGDGQELFYLAPDGAIMSAGVTTTPGFQSAEPKPLFKGPPSAGCWDVSADGQKFLMPVPLETGPASYKVVLNWRARLK